MVTTVELQRLRAYFSGNDREKAAEYAYIKATTAKYKIEKILWDFSEELPKDREALYRKFNQSKSKDFEIAQYSNNLVIFLNNDIRRSETGNY